MHAWQWGQSTPPWSSSTATAKNPSHRRERAGARSQPPGNGKAHLILLACSDPPSGAWRGSPGGRAPLHCDGERARRGNTSKSPTTSDSNNNQVPWGKKGCMPAHGDQQLILVVLLVVGMRRWRWRGAPKTTTDKQTREPATSPPRWQSQAVRHHL